MLISLGVLGFICLICCITMLIFTGNSNSLIGEEGSNRVRMSSRDIKRKDILHEEYFEIETCYSENTVSPEIKFTTNNIIVTKKTFPLKTYLVLGDESSEKPTLYCLVNNNESGITLGL